MPDFLYRARDSSGNIVQGTLSAQSRDDLVDILQRRNLLVTYIEALTSPKSTVQKKEYIRQRSKSKFRISLFQRVKLDDLTLFARQLSTLLNAGVPLLRSLTILTKQVESLPLQEAISGVRKDIQSGFTLRDSLAKYPQIFTKFWVNLVGTGEASGQLPLVLGQIAVYFENEGALRRKIISALIYPAILMTVAVVAIFIFIMKIVPIFAAMFESFDVELPQATKFLIVLSKLLGGYNSLWVIASLIIGFFILKKVISTKHGRFIFDSIRLKLPIFGNFFRNIAIATFTRGLGTMISSGVPILYALEIVTSTVGNSVIERSLDVVKESVREGKTVAEPLEANTIFPPLVVQMVNVGEETGNLADMLIKIAEFYEERVTVVTERMASLIEPIMLVFMGIIIGAMVVSMFLPIFKLATSVR
ncbi:MAG: type II secretion system F family protein [Candidatus Omnitrophota bacterium]